MAITEFENAFVDNTSTSISQVFTVIPDTGNPAYVVVTLLEAPAWRSWPRMLSA